MQSQIKTIRFWIESTFLVVSFLMLLGGLIYVLMNWPSMWQRFRFRDNQVVEAEGMILGKEENKMWGISSLINLPDDVLVEPVIWALYKDNVGKMQDNFIYIPAIDVKTPLVYLEENNDELMKIKLKEGVVHYPKTALPGQKGNAFIFGHSSYYWWDDGGYNTIFANLESLNIGDKIMVFYNGNLYVYEIKEKKIVEPTDFSVLEQGDSYRLSLMTCTPLGTDLRRFIVVAELQN